MASPGAPRVRLRPSRPEDLAFVTALERRPDHAGIIGQWSDDEHLCAIAGAQGREHWIVEDDGRPVGYLIAYNGQPHYPGLYIKRILVDEKERGIGTQVVAMFLAMAFARPGVEFAWLNVRGGNARAERVYRKFGFERHAPPAAELERLARSGEAPIGPAFSMRVDRQRWQAKREVP